MKVNLANSELLDKCLMGNEGYFSIGLIEEDKTLEHFVDFETALKIILSMNSTYGFGPNPFSETKKEEMEKPVGPKKTRPTD